MTTQNKTIKTESFAKAKKLREFVKEINENDNTFEFDGHNDCYLSANYDNDRNPNEFVKVDVRLMRFCQKTRTFQELESLEFYGENYLAIIYGDSVSAYKKSVKSFIKSLKVSGKQD